MCIKGMHTGGRRRIQGGGGVIGATVNVANTASGGAEMKCTGELVSGMSGIALSVRAGGREQEREQERQSLIVGNTENLPGLGALTTSPLQVTPQQASSEDYPKKGAYGRRRVRGRNEERGVG